MNNKILEHKKNNTFLIICCLLIGFIFGYCLKLFLTKPPKKVETVLQKESREYSGKLTNPLLECAENRIDYTELRPFKSKIEDIVSKLEGKNEVSQIAVYFRDLNNGPWFGIDEQAAFAPASLLKVPLAIAYYKLSETDPKLLEQEYLFTEISDLPFTTQNILPKDSLVPGKSYKVEDLIYRMLAYSDNDSYSLLLDNLSFSRLAEVYKDFGFNLDSLKNTDEIVNVQNYSSFFRILYNASYLNQTDSEKILSILSKTDFKDGLVAGVPTEVLVSHKFGERGVKNSKEVQFSDCGIVYYPGRPYLVCLMTKGTNIKNQTEVIKFISSNIFAEVSNQK